MTFRSGVQYLSLKGCRTRREAEERLTAWVHGIFIVDPARQIVTDLLTTAADETLNIDCIDAALEAHIEPAVETIQAFIRGFRRATDEAFGPDETSSED